MLNTFFAESKLSDKDLDASVAIDNFVVLRHDRKLRGGGGVALYVDATLKPRILSTSTESTQIAPEFLIAEVSSGNSNLLIAVVYRPPHALLPCEFFNVLSSFYCKYDCVVITGDFNCNMSVVNAESRFMRNYIEMYSLYLVPSDPTHHALNANREASHTWLDLFIVHPKSCITRYVKSDAPFTVGHDIIELDICFTRPCPPRRKILRRSYSRFDSARHLTILDDFLFNISTCGGSLDDGVGAVTRAITDALNTTAPLREIVSSGRRKPWVNGEIRDLMRVRDSLYKRARDCGSLSLLAAYRDARAKVLRLLRRGKNQYYSQFISEAMSAGCDIWRTLRRLGLISTNSPSPFISFSTNDFISYYASITNIPAHLLRIPLPPLPAPSHHIPLFDFSEVSPEDIRRVLGTANSKSSGLDGISVRDLRVSCPAILTPLSNLFNLSLKSAIFPAPWKRTLISPIPKVSAPSALSDFRPIARLSECSKLLERILAEQITSFLECFDLIQPRQAGFRSGHSTQSALLGVLDDVRSGMDASMFTILVLFDFSRAFDSIPHHIMLHKLHHLHFSSHSIAWFSSYLSDRSQAVVDEHGGLSGWAPVNLGVPQGSVLGPLLFTMFVNDISLSLRHTKCMLYADDTQIYRSCKRHELEDAIRLVSCDAEAIFSWASANGLTLNLTKTKVMILGSSANLSKLDLSLLPRVTVNGTPLDFVSEVKNLGVRLCADLGWSSHVSQICGRVFGTLRQFRPHQHALSFSTRKLLIQSLIFRFFDYACLTYHGLTEEQNLRLQRAQNACTRFVFGNIPWWSHVTSYRVRLGWLSVRARREYFLGTLTFSLLKTGKPEYLASWLIKTAEAELRRSDRLVTAPLLIRTHKTSLLANSFHLTASRFWNSLPTHISSLPTNTTSLKLFKSQLLCYLISREVDQTNTQLFCDTS